MIPFIYSIFVALLFTVVHYFPSYKIMGEKSTSHQTHLLHICLNNYHLPFYHLPITIYRYSICLQTVWCNIGIIDYNLSDGTTYAQHPPPPSEKPLGH